jgi:uncharacterized protein
MSREVAFAAARLGMESTFSDKTRKSDKSQSGLLFYGGEPLLERNLIYDVVKFTQSIKKKTEHIFYYKITTNGTLLDEKFLKFAEKNKITIAFSHDGLAQDECRLFHDGSGSFAVLEEKIPLLLKFQPYAVAMSVVDPSTVHRAAETVNFLYEKGFRYITVGVNYCKTAPWTRDKLAVFESEYNKIAQMYIDLTMAEKKVYISAFDMKILSHLKGENYNSDRNIMAMNQPSVAPNGKIYYASKYLNDAAFEIGDVFCGIDKEKQKNISRLGMQLFEPCNICAIKSRCNYAYDNLRFEKTYVSDATPVQCAHEQLLTPIADRVAETLFENKSELFIHKHYNEMYPILSLAEESARGAPPTPTVV